MSIAQAQVVSGLQLMLEEIQGRLQATEEQNRKLGEAVIAIAARVEELEGAGKRRWFTLKDVRDAKTNG